MSYNEPTPPPGGPSDHWCGTYTKFIEEWCEACQAAASERIRDAVPIAYNRNLDNVPTPGITETAVTFEPVTIPDEAMSELLKPVLASYDMARVRNDPSEFAMLVLDGPKISESTLSMMRMLANSPGRVLVHHPKSRIAGSKMADAFKSWREAARYAEWVNRHDAGRSDAEESELDE